MNLITKSHMNLVGQPNRPVARPTLTQLLEVNIYLYISETLSLHMLLLSIGYQGNTNNRFLIQFLNRDQRSIIRLSVTAVNLSSAFFTVFFSVVIPLALVVVFLPILLIVVVRKYRRTGSRQEVNENMEMVAIPNKL